ncbi:splicing factor Cactin-like [Liolophura sinensis]|uniref:splicing factor Cactin-like n=1 Tax=Liolophura sinensis TaxID=3198878 RepID=UPI0031592F1E
MQVCGCEELKDKLHIFRSGSLSGGSSSSSNNSHSETDSSRSRSPVRKHKKRSERSRSREKKKKKKEKHKKRSRSRSRERAKRKKSDRRKDTVEKPSVDTKTEKELLKALETPEEKRARRMAKKEAKERKRKEQMGWDQEYMGYSNADNPFGDEHLLETFVWTKKMSKEGKKNVTVEEIQQLQRRKMEENRRELEKVKKRRQEREREMEEREKEREKMQREKEAEYFREWEKQEDTFHLQQAMLRSEIRIQDGRAKPIDLLAKYISAEDDELAIEMHEPYTYLHGMTITDLEDLLEDIKVYLELEEGKNVDFWRDIIIVTEDELKKLRKLDPSIRDHVGDRREGINQAVTSEVSNVFKGKTTNQLLLLEEQIHKKLRGGEGVDIGYWESLLQQLKAHMAKTRLRERHQEVLRQKLFKLKQEQGIESNPLFPIVQEGSVSERSQSPGGIQKQAPAKEADLRPGGSSQSPEAEPGNSNDASDPEPGNSKENPTQEVESVLTEEDLLDQSVDEYEAGKYSPKLIRPEDLDYDTVIYETEDDLKKLAFAREQVQTTGRVKMDQESEFIKKAREGMNDEEAQFSVEVPIEQQAFLWSDKYRPRKPRFFNRVHTGFEWNKYNQTHYDIDNPPPKIVQGYKFNIFYPDLIDKHKTPSYTLTPMEDNKDFSTLLFSAGPPYEDIAFKIVNREWEYSYKRGFRCQFQNNIFQLWFHFKRYRYRR